MDYVTQILKTKWVWSEMSQALKEFNFQARLKFSAKVSFNFVGEIKSANRF